MIIFKNAFLKYKFLEIAFFTRKAIRDRIICFQEWFFETLYLYGVWGIFHLMDFDRVLPNFQEISWYCMARPLVRDRKPTQGTFSALFGTWSVVLGPW